MFTEWPATAPLSAAALGFTTHLYCRRNEPDTIRALSAVILGVLALFAFLLFATSTTPFGAALETLRLAGIYLATTMLSIGVYRVGPWHPLAAFPGPFWCRISMIPWLRQNVGLHTRFWLEKMHAEYGEFVRIGPNQISINNCEGVHVVQGFKGWERSRAHVGGVSAARVPEDSSLSRMRPREAHRMRRRIYEPAFVQAALETYEPVIYSGVAKMIKLLDARQDKIINLAEYIRYFTWDFMNEVVFGVSTDALETAHDKTGVLNGIVHVTRWATMWDACPWIRDILFYVIPLPQTVKTIMNYATTAFIERYKRGPGTSANRDLFSYLLGEDQETGGKLNATQLGNDSFALVIGGSDTTAATYSLAFVNRLLRALDTAETDCNLHFWLAVRLMHILNTPGLYNRLYEELASEFQHKPVSIAGTRELPLLNACINESLRLMNPFPSGTGRECPSGGRSVAGRFIPEYTTVRHPAFVIMRDPANFSPGPTEFRPDRWLEPEKEEAFNLKAYYPFNVGHHRCIGERLALQEVRYTIAATVLNFDMSLAPGFDVSEFCQKSCMDAFFFSFDDPIQVVLRRRTDADFVIPTA